MNEFVSQPWKTVTAIYSDRSYPYHDRNLMTVSSLSSRGVITALGGGGAEQEINYHVPTVMEFV
jgi:hypothetical protein